MKNAKFILLAAVVGMLLLLVPNGRAVLYVDFDPASPATTAVSVGRTDFDDDMDEDNSDEIRDAFFDNRYFVVQVDNEATRFVGVYVDRIIQGQGVTPVDNGSNDLYITPLGNWFSVDTLWTFFHGETPSSSRRYILPVPESLGPGDEMRCRVKVVGPAMFGTLPFDVTGAGAPPEADQLIVATASTTIQTILMPLLSMILEKQIPKPEEIPPIVMDFVNFLATNNMNMIYMYEQGDYSSILLEVIKWVRDSEELHKIIQKRVGGEALFNVIDSFNNLMKKPFQLAESFTLLITLSSVNWLTEVDAFFVFPQVEDLNPPEGWEGDAVTIRGKGFDTYEPLNNVVYFSELVGGGVPVPTLEATVLEVPDEETMVVEVPPGFHPGPVKVVVDGFESNHDVFFDEALTSQLVITEPSPGQTVRGDVQISAALTDPPDPFPLSQARLLVDGSELLRIDDVLSPDIRFIFDSTSVAPGPHTLTLELTLQGKTVSGSVDVTVEEAPTGTYLIIHSPIVSGAYFAKNEPINVQAEVINAPEPSVSSGGGYANFRLSIDGISVLHKRNEIGTSTFPGCYRATLAYLDLDMAEGLHSVKVEASSSDLVSGENYSLMESFDITVGPPEGDPNTIDLSGEICHLNFSLVLKRKDANGYHPFDVTVRVGYCCEPYRPELFEGKYVWLSQEVWGGELNAQGVFVALTGAPGDTMMGGDLRVYLNESTGGDVLIDAEWPTGPVTFSLLSGAGSIPWNRVTHVCISFRENPYRFYGWPDPPQCRLTGTLRNLDRCAAVPRFDAWALRRKGVSGVRTRP